MIIKIIIVMKMVGKAIIILEIGIILIEKIKIGKKNMMIIIIIIFKNIKEIKKKIMIIIIKKIKTMM